MPSINEIAKYIDKYSVIKKDLVVYEEELIEDIEYDMNKYLSAETNLNDIVSSCISILSMAQRAYASLYLNAKENNQYLCSYNATSSILVISDYYNKLSQRKSFIKSLSEQGEILLMSFACNRFELIEPCYPKVIESILSGKMSRSLPWGGDCEGNVVPPQPQRLSILAIEMMASERKQTIDWVSANIPVDPFYQRFCQEALYSTDKQELTYWLTKLCDNHLQWTSLFSINAERQPATGYEIADDVLLLWPFEYQAVKNFRARHGLSTPEIDHPLLKTPMAIDHRPNFALWQKLEWFDELVDKVTEINPELNFIKEWFK